MVCVCVGGGGGLVLSCMHIHNSSCVHITQSLRDRDLKLMNRDHTVADALWYVYEKPCLLISHRVWDTYVQQTLYR